MKCEKCGHEPEASPLFRDRFNQPVFNLDTMLAVVTLNQRRHGESITVTSDVELLIPRETVWDSYSDKLEIRCQNYYSDAVVNIECTRGEKLNLICLNKSMGDMQRDGSI